MSHFLELAKRRRSIRAFKSDPISEDTLLQILEAGRWAPSARNCQPVEHIVVSQMSKRQELAKSARQPQPVQAPVCIVVTVDLDKAAKAGEFSPKDVTTIERAANLYCHLDAGAAIENMILAATDLGIGSLWISGFDESELTKVINLPKGYKPIAIIVLGFAKRTPPPPPRRELRDTVHKETFHVIEKDDSYLEYGRAIDIS